MESQLTEIESPPQQGTALALVSYYSHYSDTASTKVRTLASVLEEIRSTTSTTASLIRRLRSLEPGTTAWKKRKEALPCVTLAGVFSYRNNEGLTAHSGFIVIDLDKVEGLAEWREIIEADPYTFALFISPSGLGLKALIRIDPTRHAESFEAIVSYYQAKGFPAVSIDEGAKALSQLCFLSHDPNLYTNPDSLLFPVPDSLPIETPRTMPTLPRASDTTNTANTPYGLAALQDEADKVKSTPKGGRNRQAYNSALKVGSLVSAGEIERTTAEQELLSAARQADLEEKRAATAVRNGLKNGEKNPRKKPESKRVAQQVSAETETPAAPIEPTGPKLQTMTAAALMDLSIDPMQWIVRGLIPPGLMMLAGRPKGGKSWLMLHIAFAVAGGGVVFGKYKAERAPVLYCTLEDSPRRLQTRCQAMLMKGGSAPELLHFATEIRNFASGGLDDLREWLDKYGARLIIIDTWAKARPPQKRGGNAYDDEYAATGAVHKLALERGVAIVLVHHTTKAKAEDVFDEISGTTGTTAAADTLAVLRKGMDGITRELHITGRDMDQQEIGLKFEPEYGAWSCLGDLSEIRISNERESILETIREAGKGLTPAVIARELGRQGGAIRKLLKKMLTAGALVKNPDDGTYSIPAKEREGGEWG